MKEATGELNMTVVTVVIIAALAAVIGGIIVPMIAGGLRNESCEAILGTGAKAVKNGSNYWCCPTGTFNRANCQQMED